MLFKSVGLQQRIAAVILGTALLAFLIVSVGLTVFRAGQAPARVEQFLSPYAEIIAVSAAPAVAAGDTARVQEILNSLKSSPQILRADVLLPHGRTMATYPANQSALEQSVWDRPDGVELAGGSAELIRTFSLNNRQSVRVFLRMTLAVIQHREQQALLQMCLSAGVILAVVALLQFVLLRRRVLSPLAQLADVAENAGRAGDYSQRLPAHDRDEFGQLGKSFNALLVAVEQREHSLRRLANFQRAILNDAAYAIVSTDTDGRISSVNPAAENLFGRRADELIGRATPEIFHDPAELAARAQQLAAQLNAPVPAGFEALVAEARRGLRSDAEWNYVRPDGSRVPVLLSVTALRDERGEIFGFLGMARNITEQKQAEASLRESRRLYEDLVASVPLGVYRFTATETGRPAFEYVSERFCEVTGLRREAALTEPNALLAMIHLEDREPFAQALAAATQTRALLAWEGRAVVTGKVRWLRFEARPTLQPDRSPFWTGVVFDVTDRRDVEEALRQQHSLLTGTLQATADGILAVSASGRVTSYNRQFLELWRVPEELLETHDTAALADYILQQLSNPAAMRTRIRQFNDTSKADTFDTLDFADGRVFERFSRPQLVEGRVVGRVWSFRDVTARHRAVASLQESEHKFKTLFETANDAILIVSETGFLDCNHRTEIMFGCPRGKIIGQAPADFSPERQVDGRLSEEKYGARLRAALAGMPQFFEWIHTRGDGMLFNAEVSLNRLELRGQTVVQAIVRDITARKQAEAARHEAEELYRTLINTSPDGIAVLDMAGRVLFSSPKAVELFYGSANVQPRPGRNALDYASEGSRPRALEVLRRAFIGELPQNERLELRRFDGREFVAELNGALLRDSLGVPRGVMIIFRDVTERQRQEDELKNKNTELERFTYTVSHDLKSPLITINGFAGALLADAAAGRTDRLTDDLKRIVTAADKMADLLNGLLELSRIGRIVNPPVVVSMDKLVADVLELLAGSIQQRQAKVTVQPGLPSAVGDAQRLQEVLQNLLENALKFAVPGRPPEIEIGYAAVGDTAAYFVRDHGQGVERRHQEMIFGLFNKLDARSPGTGLGLALARRIVEFHGGRLWVESAGPGEGATFYFTLPGRKAT